MSHDASKALMGNCLSSDKDISVYDSDPASFEAGKAVSLASNGGLSLLKSAGRRIGVSLGKSLSDTKKTSVLRAGLKVPVKLALKRAQGLVTITDYAALTNGTDDTVTVGATAFTAIDGAVVSGQANFDARTSNSAAATSLAAQINAHATAGALVKAVADDDEVILYAKVGGTGGNAIALAYANLGTGTGATVSGAFLAGGSNDIGDIDHVTIGAKAYINDTLGIFDLSVDGTISDAVYVSGPLTGIDEAGNEVPCALVDMQGGL